MLGNDKINMDITNMGNKSMENKRNYNPKVNSIMFL